MFRYKNIRSTRRSQEGSMFFDFLGILLVLLLILGILAAIAVPNFLEANVRSKVSRTRADMRSLAVALEAYYVDNNTYPEPTPLSGELSSSQLSEFTFTWSADSPRATAGRVGVIPPALTTPIAYMTHRFEDPFAPAEVTFLYAREGALWLLISPGPDEAYDIDGASLVADSVRDDSGESIEALDAALRPLTYDPTNGTNSRGDVWRRRQ